VAYTRPFPNLAQASVLLIASGATSLISATNLGRADLKLQGADAFFMGVASGVPSALGGPPGLLVASGAISPAISHTGPVYAISGAANGATIAIRCWESSM
jgi:hypothetical protein